MKQPLTLTLLVATMLVLTACGAGGTDQSEKSAPPEPRTQETSAPESVTGEAVQEKTDPTGLSVTTIKGEQVRLGQGEVTALFFMAGW
ncbi:MAG: hypothetical protein M3157_03960 [Actinomycetota bacterium]|nr:hypothetical protein [Actinomycetota bacterium]